jgi:hypothetical protein
MNWTEEELIAYQERQSRHKWGLPIDVNNIVPESEPDTGPESVLQLKIESWLDSHAIAYVHDRSRGRNRPGQPDIIAAMPFGVTLWIELKSKTGRLSVEQKIFQLKLLRLDHLFFEIRSFKKFLEIAAPMVAAK